ncbi:MAG TPA: phosphoglycerate kinase [Candidatus Paceibacterota bacterium]|nr:phosphoglycerate kinase [Candidatus Paceibacterota bacterium]
MKSIKDIKNLSGKKVVLRVDFNVPMKNGVILDDFRIKKAVPTILFLQKKGAKVVIISHLGDEGNESLKPIALRLKKYVKGVNFLETSIFSDETEKQVNLLKKGEIVLLENLRRETGEKKNSPSFARALSRYGEIYVNDAFSVSHREHASIVGITKYLPGYAGLQLVEEIENLSKVFNPSHPFLFILGGAKFDTKIPLIKKYLRSADNIFIGGAIANDFFRARGYEIGASLVGENNFQIPVLLKSKNLVLPTDVKVILGSKNRITKPIDVSPLESIVDIGPQTIENLKDLINKASFILWNGPLGKYETGFGGATEEVLKIISKSKAHSVIGGGDTTALISKLKIEDKLGFVSTGGGATLDFLSKGTLPGIRVLK